MKGALFITANGLKPARLVPWGRDKSLIYGVIFVSSCLDGLPGAFRMFREKP